MLKVQAKRMVAHELTYPLFLDFEPLAIASCLLYNRHFDVINGVPMINKMCSHWRTHIFVLQGKPMARHTIFQGLGGLANINVPAAELHQIDHT